MLPPLPTLHPHRPGPGSRLHFSRFYLQSGLGTEHPTPTLLSVDRPDPQPKYLEVYRAGDGDSHQLLRDPWEASSPSLYLRCPTYRTEWLGCIRDRICNAGCWFPRALWGDTSCSHSAWGAAGGACLGHRRGGWQQTCLSPTVTELGGVEGPAVTI